MNDEGESVRKYRGVTEHMIALRNNIEFYLNAAETACRNAEPDPVFCEGCPFMNGKIACPLPDMRTLIGDGVIVPGVPQ